MSKKFISVIINNYNYGKFISEAINSVLNQTYKNYEIIIVDDGSTDNSRDIILNYYNKYKNKIKYIFKSNGGQASAFNAGYKVAKGDLICFLDSDDYWYNNKLETIIKYSTQYDFIGHNKDYSVGSASKESLKFIEQHQRLLKEYGQTFLLTTSTMSLSRKILDIVLPMPEEDFRICADNYLMIYSLYLSNIKYLQESLSYYRIHGENRYVGKANARPVTDISFMSIKKINEILVQDNKSTIPYMDYKMREKILKVEESIEIEPKNYVLYGTGEYSKIVKDYLEYCGANIVYYCDSNSKKWGSKIDNIEIISPNELLKKRDKYYKIFIASMWIYEISNNLNKLGLKKDIDYIYSEIGF